MAVLPGDDSYTWTAGDGTVLDFTDRTKWAVMPGDEFGIMPQEHVTRRTPYLPGSVPIFFRPQERQLTLRIFIRATSYPVQLALRQQLVKGFSTYWGEGTLQILRADGSLRQITGAVKQGPSFSASSRKGVSRLEIVQLECATPFFIDPTVVTTALTPGLDTGGTPLTYPQTLPFALGGAAGFGVAVASVTNAGDWEAYPTITIPGPCVNPSVSNSTTNPTTGLVTTQTLAWTGMVPSGYTLSFLCAQANPAVTLTDPFGNASDGWYGLVLTSTFWPLLPGQNSISFAATSAGGAAASLVFFSTYSGI